jgi:galactonate dehydratase
MDPDNAEGMDEELKITQIEPLLYFQWLAVKVHTDTPIIGIGQSGYWAWPSALVPIILSFRELLIGQDPLRVEDNWQRMYRWRPFPGSALSGAVSAVDIALWDIAGKALDVPIHQLLGGPQRERIRLHVLIDGDTTDDLVRNAVRAKADGFTAIKFDAFPVGMPERETFTRTVQVVVDRISAVRETVGWDTDLIVELHRDVGLGEAIVIAKEIERFRPYFLEDPLKPESEQDLKRIASQTSVPIGAGERCCSVAEFRGLLDSGIRFVRPDVGLAGGITHCRKIAAVAEAFEAQVCSHNFFSPLLTAATVQLYASIPNAATLEYVPWEAESPRSEMLKDPLRPEAGHMRVPDAPGLGVTLNEEMIDRYPFEPWNPNGVRLRSDGSVYWR